MKNYVIAVDLGGTNLRVGAVREDGVVEGRESVSSDSRAGSDVVLGRIVELVHAVASKIEKQEGTIHGVALGIAGIVDSKKGIVYQLPHFPDWKNLNLLNFFKEKFPWPVMLDNDANFVALGEGWRGAGQGIKNFVMLTFGTGLGGGIIIDGRLYHGDRGFAGEVGHICVETEGLRCACGSRGCLEMYVSSQGILKFTETSHDEKGREKLLERLGKPLERLTVRDLHEAALDGDIFANVTFKKMGYYLGIGLAALTNTLGIETFVIGGGISRAWDFFIEAAKNELAERTYEEVAKSIQIKKAVLGDDAGLIGGAAAILKPSLP